MSTFKSEPIFPGPHTFHVGPAGSQLIPKTALGKEEPGHQVLGALETRITVRGRLVAPDPAALDALLAAVDAQLDSPPKSGTLTDNDGHEWEDVSFVSFTPKGPINKGRVCSLAYEAVFMWLDG